MAAPPGERGNEGRGLTGSLRWDARRVWRGAASRPAAGLLPPARGLHGREVPVRSRPNPEPALAGAAGEAPSCTELLDGGCGLGRAGGGGGGGVPASPAAAVAGGGGGGGDSAAPARCGRRSERRGGPGAAGLNEGPDAGAQLLPVSGVTTGLFQAASAFSSSSAKCPRLGALLAPSRGEGGGVGGGDLGLPIPVASFGLSPASALCYWGVTPPPPRQRLSTDLAEACLYFFLPR